MPYNTLQKLQQPTFSLIESFYPMPPDVQSTFITMLSLYEQNPTSDNANLLFDKVMGRDTPEAKKEWFSERAHMVTLLYRARIEEKYLNNKAPVPKGLPTSGNLLVGLGVVSRSDKDLLMDAQAAARILDHIESPNHVRLSQELFTTDSNGQPTEARSYLDKPFSTPIQRMEHLCAIMAGYAVVQGPYQKVASNSDGLSTVPDIKPTIEEFQKAAIDTLYRVSEKLSPASQKVAAEVRKLASAYAPAEDVKDWSFEKISHGVQDILPSLFTWHGPHLDKSKTNLCEDSYTDQERELVENMIKKRITQIQTGLSQTRQKDKEAEK